MVASSAPDAPPPVIFGAVYPSRYGVAWAVWRDPPSGPPAHHDVVPGRGERFVAELCVCAYARGIGPRTEVRWLDDEAALPFIEGAGREPRGGPAGG